MEHLRTTDEHPFWVEGRGWVDAADLRPGMVLGDPDGAGGTLLTVLASVREEHPEGITVYNFEVAGDHTYFVEDGTGEALWAWVHNANYSKGGPYAKITDRRGQLHHSPADSASPLSTGRGPAWRMSRKDHMQTASWGSSREAITYRKVQRKLIREGKFFEAMQMDIDDTRSLFGDKYDKGITEAWDYATQHITNYGKVRKRPLTEAN